MDSNSTPINISSLSALEIIQMAKEHVSFDDTETAFANRSDFELKKMNLLFWTMNKPTLVDSGTPLLKLAFKLRAPFVKPVVKNTLFEHFCGGETIEDSERTIIQLAQAGIGTILDYSVEGEKSEKGFEKTKSEIIRTIHRAKGDENIPFCVFKVTGIGYSKILEKVQAHEPLIAEEQVRWEKIQLRMNEICLTAYQNKVRIFVDGEETWFQDTIDDLTYQMMEKYNKEEAIVYNTYQMYTTDRLEKLKSAYENAVKNQYRVGAKIVRGAYMEKERKRAEEKGYTDPIQPDKLSTDRDFDAALEFCVENRERIAVCAGTHNELSCYSLVVLMDAYKIDKNDSNFHFAQLYGMSDNMSNNLAAAGYNVAKYVPYGAVKDVMPYLIRRADENTAIAGQSSREYLLIQKEIERRKQARQLKP
ncbi:proline dehydrogenase family protein [Bernardetia sp.]|uniref:proline dehydrogenase family protein n=1 Tax=Bernardetia sp. TaxID=1937974 RepID=UPI0025BB3B1F|nr:proline dehydrogenase family protein [Bernardetia sp.]